MVKVISEKPVLTHKVICHYCGYELEYTGQDVKGDYFDEKYKRFIECPREGCKSKVFVKY